MQYPGVEYQCLYQKDNIIYKTIGSAVDFEDSSSRLILFSNITGIGPVYYMPEERFTNEFIKVNRYT